MKLKNVLFIITLSSIGTFFVPFWTIKTQPSVSQQSSSIIKQIRDIDNQIATYSAQIPALNKINQQLKTLQSSLLKKQQQLSRSYQNYRLQGYNYILKTAMAWGNKKQIEETRKKIIAEQQKFEDQIKKETQPIRDQIKKLVDDKEKIMRDTPHLRDLLESRDELVKRLHSLFISQEAA